MQSGHVVRLEPDGAIAEPRMERKEVRVKLTNAGGLDDGMVAIRRDNAALFQSLFAADERFIIQHELEGARSSWFSFTVILNPTLDIDRQRVMAALKGAGIGYRIITGGCFLRHDVIQYFEYDTVGEIVNANIAHDRGFFVGNHPRDLRPQIERLRQVLDRTAVAFNRVVVPV